MESLTLSQPDVDAIHDLAVKTAEGVHVPQDWDAALDHLQHAAELGSVLAQAELAGLAGRWKLAHAILTGKTLSWWERLRHALDPRRWLNPGRSQWSRFRSAI